MSFNSPSGGGGGGGGEQSSRGTRRPYDEQSLIPVTILMVRNAASSSSGQLTLADGRELTTVKFVGAVRGVVENSTHVRYDVEDGTGLVAVQQYVDDATECAFVRNERERTSRTENCYVRVVGQVKEYEGRKNVVGFSVRLLSTGNELTHHMLEVVYSGERHKKLTGGGGGGASGHNLYGTNTSVSSPKPTRLEYSDNNNNSNYQQHRPQHQQQQHSLYNGESGPDGPLHEAVLAYIKNHDDGDGEVGADVNHCIRSLAGQFTEAQIRRSVDHLSAEGHIYSTIDETKFKYAM